MKKKAYCMILWYQNQNLKDYDYHLYKLIGLKTQY